MSESVIDSMRRHTKAHIRDWWSTLFDPQPGRPDGIGLFGPTAYALQIGGARLLVDPCFRDPAWGDGIADRIQADLATIDGILITHEHADHFCPHFCRLAADAQVTWYIPDFIPDAWVTQYGLQLERVVRTHAGMQVSFHNAQVTFFESNHKNEGVAAFVREYGFTLRHDGKTHLFPGDVRTYDPTFYPAFGDIEICFAHLWLGRENALHLPCEPKLTEFCRFIQTFAPKQVMLGHLYETGRLPEDLWTDQHARLVADRMRETTPSLSVTALRPGIWYPVFSRTKGF